MVWCPSSVPSSKVNSRSKDSQVTWPVILARWLNECPSTHPEHPCNVLRICEVFCYHKIYRYLLKDRGLKLSVIQNGEP